MRIELSEDEIHSAVKFGIDIAEEGSDFWSVEQKYKSNCLGYGCFSVVMRHPTRDDVAIKISTLSDDGGVLYAFWARANQGLAGVPEVLHIEQVKVCGTLTTIILTKRYDWTVAQHSEFEVAEGVSADNFRRYLCRRFEDGSTSRQYSSHPKLEAYVRTLDAIAKFFKGAARFDLHDENCMIDEKLGEFIIIDPLSFARSE